MFFSISRDIFLKPLALACGVVEKSHPSEILKNVFLSITDNNLIIAGSDSELEFKSYITIDGISENGAVTIPGKRIYDWVKNLPVNSFINIKLDDNSKVTLKSANSVCRAATLPVNSFPFFNFIDVNNKIIIDCSVLKTAIDKVYFSMAEQDIRYFFNGLLFDLRDGGILRLIATDGHRLSLANIFLEEIFDNFSNSCRVIIPRKAIIELSKFLVDYTGNIEVAISQTSISFSFGLSLMFSRLIDGKFPDYEKVLPQSPDLTFILSRNELKLALARLAVFSIDKMKPVLLELSGNDLKLSVKNSNNDEAVENFSVDFTGPIINSAFNLSYLIDSINAIEHPTVLFSFVNPQSSLLLEAYDSKDFGYVIMPMRI